MEVFMITTADNPFDPFDQFDDWYQFDEDAGYHTMNYLARIVEESDWKTERENNEALNEAVKEIARMNITGNYRLVRRDQPVDETDETDETGEADETDEDKEK